MLLLLLILLPAIPDATWTQFPHTLTFLTKAKAAVLIFFAHARTISEVMNVGVEPAVAAGVGLP